MNKENEIFLQVLYNLIPQRKKLVKTIEEVIDVGTEAVYRRLRGDVAFTFPEIAQICRKLSISIDNIFGISVDELKVRPCRLNFLDFINPNNTDIEIMDNYMEVLEKIKHYDKSELYCASNTLPQIHYVSYEYLYRFYLLKWKYQQNTTYEKIKFKDIPIVEKMVEINKKYQETHREANHTSLILDPRIFSSIVNDISYFKDIGYIDSDDITSIKQELLLFIDELEDIMLKGYINKGKDIDIYISNIDLEASHVCLAVSENLKISMTKWFSLTDTFSVDELSYEKMKNWMQAIKRSSILVSGSSEMERMKFLEDQRAIVNKL